VRISSVSFGTAGTRMFSDTGPVAVITISSRSSA
jgi:hypothetical protein